MVECRGSRSISGQGNCFVFLGKTLHSRSSSRHSSVLMGTEKCNAGGNPAIDQHPIREGVERGEGGGESVQKYS